MKPLLLLISFVVSFPTILWAQAEGPSSETMIYKTVGGNELQVTMFYAAKTKRKNNNPAIAFFHGGGWVFGDPSEFHGACKRYAMLGFTTFSFQYRLSINEDKTYPHPDITLIECVKDARSAIRWMRENAASLKIDPDKIIVGGQSAGGQLALGTALFDTVNEDTDNLDTSPIPNALLLYSSAYSAMEPWIDMIMKEDWDEIRLVSPYHNLREGMPPVLAFHSRDDCMVLHYSVLQFEKKMEKLENPFELITLDGIGHYLGEGNEQYSRLFDEKILERTDEFLLKHGFMEKKK